MQCNTINTIQYNIIYNNSFFSQNTRVSDCEYRRSQERYRWCIGTLRARISSKFAQFAGFYRAAFYAERCYPWSVRLSVCETCELWQNETNLCPNSYTTRTIDASSFATRRMVSGDIPFYLKFWNKVTPSSKNANVQSIFARSASAVTLSWKS